MAISAKWGTGSKTVGGYTTDPLTKKKKYYGTTYTGEPSSTLDPEPASVPSLDPVPVIKGPAPKASAQSFIRQREKRAGEYMRAGYTAKQAQTKAAADISAGAPGFGGERGEQITVEQAQREKAKVTGELEEAGAFEDVTPQEVSLAPSEQFGEGLAVVGPGTAAIQGTIANAINKGWIPILETKEEDPLAVTPETAREAALQQVRINSFEEGVSSGESIGAVIEAIPGVGGFIGKYVGGLVEAPYANSREVVAEIEKIKEAASTGQEKVRNGLEDPEYGLTRAREMEEDIAKLEGRLKALINTSAILRANKDEVNKIQEAILIAKEKIARYRQASTFGLTASLTGTGRVIPTDEQMYFELKRQNEGS